MIPDQIPAEIVQAGFKGWDRRQARSTVHERVQDALAAAWPLIAAHVVEHEGNGYHTHAELYRYRMLYNAHAAAGWLVAGLFVVKSWNHSDGEPCFGGGWFVVVANLPSGSVSNHYEAGAWDLFDVPEVDRAPTWDGHTPAEAADRLEAALRTRVGLVQGDPNKHHPDPDQCRNPSCDC